jgi:ParB family transcriptional regulator, chromosome partitioning protein
MPETKSIMLTEIDEPVTPARMAMDDKKLADLMDSMKTIGQVHAIAVGAKDGRYEIIAGHRRFVAATQLGWTHIRAEVFQSWEMPEAAAMLAENIHREELSAAEEALLFQEHRERYELDEAGLCARFKVSPDYLGDRLRLLRGDAVVFAALLERRINFSVAREINKCEDEGHRRYLLDIAISTGYSAAVMASHVRQWRQNTTPPTGQVSPPPQSEQPAPPPEYRQECVFCGGYRDPWAMVSVMVHKHELEAILKQLQQAALAE